MNTLNRYATAVFLILLALASLGLVVNQSHRLPIAAPLPLRDLQPTSPTLVFITPENVSDLSKTSGTVTFGVNVTGSPSIRVFLVSLVYNTAVFSVKGVNYIGNVLGASATPLRYCVDGQSLISGAECLTTDITGWITLSLYLLGGATSPSSTNGLLFHVTFNIIGKGFAQLHLFQAVLTNGVTNQAIPTSTQDGYFTNVACPKGSGVACKPLFASFTVSPSRPSPGSAASFNATAVDPNAKAKILSYTWTWGDPTVSTDQNSTTTPRIGLPVSHIYQQAGNYSVTLQVFDNETVSWQVTQVVQVTYLFLDLAVGTITVDNQFGVYPGTLVHMTAEIVNNSTISTNGNLTIVLDTGLVLGSREFVNLPVGGTGTLGPVTWNTTGYSPRTYRIDVIIPSIVGENITSNNIKSTSVQLIPSPTSQDIPPVASFTFSPTNPVLGQDVTFDGSGSFDPDGAVRLWTWSFGDGNSFSVPFPNVDHTYFAAGNYTVTLTVQDNAGLTSSKSMSISVRPQPPHDVSIVQVNAFPQTAVSSQNVGIQVRVRNDGSNDETVSLTAYANGQAVQTLRGIFLPACHPGPFGGFFCFGFFEEITWDTTGTAPGNYTISASVSLAAGEVDPTPADNIVIDSTVTVLPPPVISLNPSSGIVGTKVLVTGTGFPLLTPFGFGPVGIVQVSFDNMFLGFTLTHNGTFTFTLDVIEAQPGTHQVIALDQATGAHAAAMFTILPTPTGNLEVTVSAGTIYFPEDTLVAYVLTRFNGVPVGPTDVQLQVLLFFPNGTSRTLTPTSMGRGLYKATYVVPKTGPLGTYVILAKAHHSGPFDASAIASFEVKLSWVSANARSIAGAATAAGLIGLVAVAWKKGYLRRSKGEAPTPSFF